MSIKGIVVEGQEYLVNYPDLDNKPELTPEAIGAASREDFEALEETVNQQNTDILNAFPTDTVSGSIVYFPDGADELPIKAGTIHVEPVQAGSGEPSPENIREISGWTQANVEHRNKNLFPVAISGTNNGITFTVNDDGSVTCIGIATGSGSSFSRGVYFSLKPGKYKKPVVTSGVGVYVQYIDAQGDTTTLPGGSYASSEFEITDEIYKLNTMFVRLRVASGTDLSTPVTVYPYFFLDTETDLTWVSPKSRTYSINFPSEAGTVYGATYDPVAKRLAVNRVTPEQKAGAYWTKRAGLNHVFVLNSGGTKTFPPSVLSNALSNVLPTVTAPNLATFDAMDYGIRVSDYLYAVNKDCSTLDEWNAFIQSAGLQVVYELETPIVYENVEIEDIMTYLGNNTFWADCGDIDLTYRADPTEYIAKKIAEIQALVLENNG